mmetsp:Transcript_20021/g.58133  ORF Transcript_20021/g.58133 Transcript_20021/m.58133 type:complete len:205 (-) Transcript_20021:278-892(-)
MRSLPTSMSFISTCQYPFSVTGAQYNSLAMRSRRYSPKVISLCSPSLPKKTPNKLSLSVPEFTSRSTIEKCGPSAICGKERPRMPSKGTKLNGSSLSSVAATKFALQQTLPCPKQTLSRTYTPLISPVPKVIVTTSRVPSAPTGVSGLSAKAICAAVALTPASKRLWFVQASEEHSREGRSKLPLPVSYTTMKLCGGLPTLTCP